MLTLCHFPRAIIRFTLSHISYTSSHFSRTLIFPSRSYIRSRLFLAPLTCSKSAILPGKNAINRGNMHHWPKYRYNAFRLRDKLFYRSDGCPQRPCCWESLQWSRTFTHSASSCGKSTPLHYSRITDIQMKKLWNSLKRLVGAFDSELTSLDRVGGKFWPWTRQRATHSFRALWALLPNLFSNSQVNLLASHLLGARWRGGGTIWSFLLIIAYRGSTRLKDWIILFVFHFNSRRDVFLPLNSVLCWCMLSQLTVFPPYFQARSPARFLMRPRYSPLDAGRMESTARA